MTTEGVNSPEKSSSLLPVGMRIEEISEADVEKLRQWKPTEVTIQVLKNAKRIPLRPVALRCEEISEADWDKICLMEVPEVVKRLRENPSRMPKRDRK